MENIESNNASMHVRTIAINMGNDTMNNDNHQIESFQLFCFVYLVSVCSSGVILNFKALSTLLSVILKQNTEQNFMFIILILTEFSISAFCIPLDIISSMHRSTIENRVFCSFQGFIHTFMGMMSLFTITGMAIIRYLSVVLLQRSWHTPIQHSIWYSRSIWTVFAIAFVLSTPPLMGFGKYVKDSSVICCAPSWSTKSSLGIVYNWSIISFGFVLPTMVICVCASLTIRKIYKQNKVLAYITQSMNSNPRRGRAVVIQQSQSTQKSSKSRLADASIVMGVMILSFYLCWTPYAIRCILGMVEVELNAKLSGISILFSKLGVIMNPLVYIFYNKEISMLRSNSKKPKKNMENSSNFTRRRRAAVRLNFDHSSDNQIAVNNINVLNNDHSNPYSINLQEDIIKSYSPVKSHSIPLVALRCQKSLALRSQSYPTSVHDLDPDCIAFHKFV